tara:strand:- start:292 stop:492 length:201 start_codon:yes stop_codon:yes gene_type:complete
MEKLIMKNIQIKDRQPPLRIQVEKGYRAFHRGRITNPYKINTTFYKEWERGFNKAYFQNLAKLNAA